MNAYLIQRAKFYESDRKGIDGILQFDYMGAAEFEWGALPESLKRMRENRKNYDLEVIVVKNKKAVVCFCTEEQKKEIDEYLLKLADRKFHLHEFSGFDTYVNEGEFGRQVDFWWDIENDLMFWKPNYEFTKQFIDEFFN